MKPIAVLLFSCLAFGSFGQLARLQLETEQLRIGEQTSLTLSFDYPDPSATARIGWPQFGDTLTAAVEIVDRSLDRAILVDTAKRLFRRRQELRITCFVPGEHLIPAIGIALDDSLYFTRTARLTVETVAVDTAKGIVDIQPNYTVTYSLGERLRDGFRRYWVWWVLGASLVGLLFLIRWWRAKKNAPVPAAAPPQPPPPAHLKALESLRELERQKAWQTAEQKLFYSELTLVVRHYLEQRFGLKAIEQTTRDILRQLKHTTIAEADKTQLQQLLQQADMVKFAKMQAGEQQGEVALYKAIDFVEKTKQAAPHEGDR